MTTSHIKNARRSGLLYILPCLFVLFLTSVYPVAFGTAISLTNWNWGNQLAFVGFSNYVNLLSSSEFWTVLGNTAVFSILATICEVSLGFYLAVQVDKLPVRTNLIQAFLLTPLMVSGIVVALMSKVLFDPFWGIINFFITSLGFSPSAFYGAADTAMLSVVSVDIWWQSAFVFIIMLAGIRGLPQDPIEAAQVEGAGSFAIFWRIKFPLLRSLLFTVLIIRSIDTLKVFDIVFGTTGGGPGMATEVVQTFAYRTAYSYLQIGKSMTVMVIFSIVILGICFLLQRLQEKDL